MHRLLQELNALVARAYDDGERRAIVEMLVEDTLGWTRTQYLARRAEPVADADAARLTERARRLAAGEPLQYVVGRADFMDLRLAVSPAVLIPRPETADLVEWIAADVRAAATPRPTMVDVGTGSGCIALSLARLINNSQVLAVDLSTDALAVARSNAGALGISTIDFLHADILTAGVATFPPTYQQVDVVVSNPPYVRLSERAAMHANVRDHEPAMALFVPDGDALVFYRAVARLAARMLRPGGAVYFEINAALPVETADAVRAEGFADVEVRADRFGKPRMLRARL